MVSMFEYAVQAQDVQIMDTGPTVLLNFIAFCSTSVIVAFCIIYLGYGHRAWCDARRVLVAKIASKSLLKRC